MGVSMAMALGHLYIQYQMMESGSLEQKNHAVLLVSSKNSYRMKKIG